MPAKSYADGIAILLWEMEKCAGSQRGCVFGMMAVKTKFAAVGLRKNAFPSLILACVRSMGSLGVNKQRSGIDVVQGSEVDQEASIISATQSQCRLFMMSC